MATEFLTPIGRLVQGDCFEAQTKNQQGQPLVDKQGNPTQRFFIAVAFAKTDAAFSAFYQLLVNEAKAGFPQLFNAQGQCTHPRFSWKLVDGDGVDDNGKQNNTKEGFAGHWVVKFSSTFPPSCYAAGKYDPAQRLPVGSIKRGYFVRVAGSIKPNTGEKPGLFVNQNMIELAGYGTEIVSGPDAGAVFGGAPVGQLPAGATAAPMSAAPAPQQAMPGMMPPAAPQQAMPGMMPPAAPQQAMPGMMPPAAPQQAMPVPNMGFVNNAGALPQMAPPAPAAPVYQMTAAAQGYTREQWNASGQTDAALIAAGYMVQVA